MFAAHRARVLCLAVMLPHFAQAQRALPAPTGPFSVGTVRTEMVDSARNELSRPNTDQVRRLIVQVWYPAKPGSANVQAPYVPEMKELAEALRRTSPDLATIMDSVRTGAFWDAPPLKGQRFPLIVFSHGMNSARYFYTTFVQDLASHGFVVAAVDHPFWSIAESFPDGCRIGFEESMDSRDKLTSDQIDGFMQGGVTTMADDEAFVAHQFARGISRFGQLIDARHIGVLGHSMGGMAATEACSTFRVFVACASLDGLVWAHEGYTPTGEQANQVNKPFLLVLSPQFLPPDMSTAGIRYRRAWRNPRLCLIPGIRHSSASDLPLLRMNPPAASDLDPRTALAVILRTVVLFFKAALSVGAADVSSNPIDTLVRTMPSDSPGVCRITGS